MKLTKTLVKSWNACADGYKYFVSNFPQGADYGAVQSKLHADKKYDWAAWLTNAAWTAAFSTPADMSALTKSEVDATVKSTKDSPNSSTGDGSKAASSGNYSAAASSGNYSAAASSGHGSTAASSGYGSTAASSGNYSTAASSGYGTIAFVAGCSGMAKAGEMGCFALCYYDGKRNRTLVGYVGEDGIKADTWYRVRNGKLVEAE
jgi:hypothetical protein